MAWRLLSNPIDEAEVLRSIHERVDLYLMASGRDPHLRIVDPDQQALDYAFEVGLTSFEQLVLRRSIERRGKCLTLPM